jgi:TPR repeat protein
VLGYISLMLDGNGKRDSQKAIQLCSTSAEAGDSYARFVLAWALLYAGDHRRALELMRAAMEARFLPAMVDFAKFAWNGVGSRRRHPEEALKALQLADQAGHKGALLCMCWFYTSGQFGIARRLLGYALVPIASLRYFVAMCSDPFSSRVFTFQKDTPRLFKSQLNAGV